MGRRQLCKDLNGENRSCNEGWGGEAGEALTAEGAALEKPCGGKEQHRVRIWVRRICMVVGCGSPGTWCHKETDLKGLEGGYPGRSMRVYSFMETEREHEFGIQHPLGENHLS